MGPWWNITKNGQANYCQNCKFSHLSQLLILKVTLYLLLIKMRLSINDFCHFFSENLTLDLCSVWVILKLSLLTLCVNFFFHLNRQRRVNTVTVIKDSLLDWRWNMVTRFCKVNLVLVVLSTLTCFYFDKVLSQCQLTPSSNICARKDF